MSMGKFLLSQNHEILWESLHSAMIQAKFPRSEDVVFLCVQYFLRYQPAISFVNTVMSFAQAKSLKLLSLWHCDLVGRI